MSQFPWIKNDKFDVRSIITIGKYIKHYYLIDVTISKSGTYTCIHVIKDGKIVTSRIRNRVLYCLSEEQIEEAMTSIGFKKQDQVIQ